MRVGFDVTPLTTGRTGVARYVSELFPALLARAVDLRPFAFGRGNLQPPEMTRRSKLPLRMVQPLWRHLDYPRVEGLVGPIDVLHACDLTPAATRARVVLTVHDLAAVELPHLHSPRQIQQQRRQVIAAAQVDSVIAVSGATAGALERAGIDPDRITVTPLGLTPLPAELECVVEQPFLLAVGEIAARKNLPTLIRAFEAARLPAQFLLVLAGPNGYRAEEALRLAGPRIRFLGPVDDDVLAGLYQHATALCFPSLAEGFGLPVLEALGAGLPIVASDIDAVREVAADAALLVPPEDEREWATALERIVEDGDLRDSLTADGRVRAKQFTWDRTAELTMSAYEKAV